MIGQIHADDVLQARRLMVGATRLNRVSEEGQGRAEYVLALGLVTLVVIAVVTIVGGWVGQDAPAPAVSVTELGSSPEPIDSEKVPLFNCSNPSGYELEVERARQIQYRILIDGQLAGETRKTAVSTLQARYGIVDGQVSERSFTVHLTAPPDSWVEYTVGWQYIWRQGELSLGFLDGTRHIHPYRVLSGLEFNIVNITYNTCTP
ncbi:MAG: hypothetical protein AB1791_03040 [Chloroflexota bacterium]